MKRLFAVLAVAALLTQPAIGAESPLELKWKQLIPPTVAAPKSSAFKPFFAGSKPIVDDGTPAPPPKEEGRWMASPIAKAQGPAPIVPELDGKTVRIDGYVVPLDFDQTRVKQFLLVPFVGACIHVPPPPANQIIYVTLDKGFEVAGTFDPVSVTGKLTAAQTFTGLAETGYSIEATAVDPRKP